MPDPEAMTVQSIRHLRVHSSRIQLAYMVPVRPSLLIQIGYQQTRVVGCKRSVISAEVKTVVLDMLDVVNVPLTSLPSPSSTTTP